MIESGFTNIAGQSQIYLRQKSLLARYLPFSAATLWRKVQKGEFPSPIKLSPGITAWREKDVSDWIRAQEVKCDH